MFRVRKGWVILSIYDYKHHTGSNRYLLPKTPERYLEFPKRFAWRSPRVHRVANCMVHHWDMDKNTTYTKAEALACAGASLLLGAYLTSAADNLLMKVILMSFPPASLFVTLRRNHNESPAAQPQAVPTSEPATFEDLTAGLEFDILTRAS